MQWEQVAEKEFSSAMWDAGVSLLPTGVIELHRDHMPLGTDCLKKVSA